MFMYMATRNMAQLLWGIFFLLILVGEVSAQVHPADNDTLHFRVDNFSVPAKKQATSYVFELWESYITDDGSEYKKLLFTGKAETNKLMLKIPEWGKSYKWQGKYYAGSKLIDSTGFSHFYVLPLKMVNNTQTNLKVLKDSTGSNSMYVFIDATHTMYDNRGNAVWFLPDIPDVVSNSTRIRDIKISPQNTITFTTHKDACEIDYYGNLLWKAPNNGKVSGDSDEHYHHEFTRLKSGNYMVLGTAKTLREVPKEISSVTARREMIKKGDKYYKEITSGSVIEYDAKGEIVWKWVSGEHFTDEDIFSSVKGSLQRCNTHMNAFYFDEKRKTVLVSFRNINRVMEVSYPSGKVIANFGEEYYKNATVAGNGLFYGQHSCSFTSKGDLLLFNNNNNMWDTSYKEAATILSLTLNNEHTAINKVWEYSCSIDTFCSPYVQGGGGVMELDNGNLGVSTGNGRYFVITPDKKLVWNSVMFYLTPLGEQKILEGGYRAFFLDSKHLNIIMKF